MNDTSQPTGQLGEELACRVAGPLSEEPAGGRLIPYCPNTTPVQFYILALARPDGVDYIPGVLIEAEAGGAAQPDPAWYRVVSCAQENLSGRVLRPFPRQGNAGRPFEQFNWLTPALLFLDAVTKPRWYVELSGRKLQAAVEDLTGVWGVAPDIWVTEPVLLLIGSRPALQIGEAGATFVLQGVQRVVGVTEGMETLQIKLPEEHYGKQAAWFGPSRGVWSYVELRYPERKGGALPSWTVGDNRDL
jgi:hypothetical protein